jgi:hypothetical protein
MVRSHQQVADASKFITGRTERFMSQRKEKRVPDHSKCGGKILKARYDASSHFAAFDVCPIRLDGKQARALRRGTLQGANRKGVSKMLTRMAESFACCKIQLESFGGPAGTFVEIIGGNGQQHV